MSMNNQINKTFFESLMTYEEYFEWSNKRFKEGLSSGDNHSESMLNYTKLGIARTRRGLKISPIDSELVNLLQNSKVKYAVIITEIWCGDAGNTTPFIHKNLNEAGIENKVMLRDKHPEIMENYLTNGGKSIPIVVFFNENFEELAVWGPRPAPAQKMVMDRKKEETPEDYDSFAIKLQKWYIEDSYQTTGNEIKELISK